MENSQNKPNQDPTPNEHTSGVTTSSVDCTSFHIVQCSENWKQMQHNKKHEEEHNKDCIFSYVKDHLFKVLKFIPTKTMMIFSFQPQSLSQLICTALNIKLEDQQCYWAK